MTTVEDADLPKALVKRIIKAKLAQLEDHPADGSKKEFHLNKDALLAFAESGKVFINYITAAANDACKEAKRQTMSEADVLTALEELHFGELIPELKQSLEAFKEDSKAKYSKKTSSDQKKRKAADKRTPAGRDQKKTVSSAPAGAAGAVPHMPPVAVPMQHLAAAAPNLVQSLMLQQLAQLSPQQQQQYVNQALVAQRAAQQQALLAAQPAAIGALHQGTPQHAAVVSGALPSQAALLPAPVSPVTQGVPQISGMLNVTGATGGHAYAR